MAQCLVSVMISLSVIITNSYQRDPYKGLMVMLSFANLCVPLIYIYKQCFTLISCFMFADNGLKYQYDIKYGKMVLGGTRCLKTV